MELQINDQTVSVVTDPDLPLLWVLRDLLGMTGTKFGCGMALCGACTVLIDGQALRSCVLPVAQAAGKKITTIEGVGATPVGAALQAAWLADQRASMRLLPGWADHVRGGAAASQT